MREFLPMPILPMNAAKAAPTLASILSRSLPTIRADVRFDSERLREMNLAGHFTLREGASLDDNATALAAFLDIPNDKAREIAATEYLFVD